MIIHQTLNETIDSAERKYTETASQFNGLNRSANNTDTPRLSVAEYSAMEKRYALIASQFSDAESLVYEAEEMLQRALRGDVPPDKTTPQAHKVAPEPTPGPIGTGTAGDKGSGGAASGRSTPPTCEDTPHRRNRRDRDRDRDKEIIIIRDSPVLTPPPVIIIEERDRHRDDRWTEERRTDPVNPVIVEEPSKGGGKESDFGSSGTGEGTARAWGSSGSGGGSERSWNRADSSSSPSNYESSDSPRTGY